MACSRVVVVGAGVAGLAAAGRLRAAGVDTVLIEAGARTGGRACTAIFRGAAFDHGASWLHDADHNPLAAMGLAEDELANSDQGASERVSIDGRIATAEEYDAYEAAWSAVDTVTAPALRGPDTTLAAGLAPLRHDPWCALVSLWEGAIIAAADADVLGLQDWHRNRLAGHNLVPRGGVGAYVVRKLATPALLDTPATAIDWSGRGVRVATSRGTLEADAAVVTVSTGVLAAGAIRFDPALPPDVEAAIAALPMGLLSKVALAPRAGRLGLAQDTLVVDRHGSVTFNAFPQDRPYLVGFYGGRLAWSVAGDPAAATDLVRAELGRAMGADAVRALAPEAALTAWGTDPLSRGAYAYAGPGDADARGTLGGAYPGERLVFAGEAVRTDGLAGTVGGAYLSGIAAAERLMRVSAAPAAVPAGSP